MMRLLSRLPRRAPRLEHKALDAYLKTLTDMLDSGLDLTNSLKLAGDLMPTRRLQQACADQADAVQEGTDWSDALEQCPWLRWPAQTRAWIQLGLSTGQLNACLTLHRQERIGSRRFASHLCQRLAYPAGVLLLSLGLAELMSSVLPDQAQSGPGSAACAAVVLALCLAAFGWATWLDRRPGGLRDCQTWWRALITLSISTESGQSLPQSIGHLTTDGSTLLEQSHAVSTSLSICLQAIEAGQPLPVAIQSAEFPKSSWCCIQLAELDGRLARALQQAASLMQIQVEHLRDQLLRTLPPLGLAVAAMNLCMQYLLFIWPLYQGLSN